MLRQWNVIVRAMISNAYLLPMFRLLVIQIRNVQRELVNSEYTDEFRMGNINEVSRMAADGALRMGHVYVSTQ